MPTDLLSSVMQGWLGAIGQLLPDGGLTRPMSLVVVVIVLALVVIIFRQLFRRRQPRYIPREYLFTATEWRFAQALQAAIGREYFMMGKVRIADLLAVESHPKIKRSDWMSRFAKISSKHIDFVLIDPETGKVVCCIELDDKSHQRADRIERDIFVNGAFKQAGVPLLRIPTQSSYDIQALQRDIAQS